MENEKNEHTHDKYSGLRAELVKPYCGLEPGHMGTIQNWNPHMPNSGMVSIQWDGSFGAVMYRHEIKIFPRHAIDEVEDEE